MLITCPECSQKVSDFASSCPECGFPVSKFKDIPTSEDEYIEYCLDSIYDCIIENMYGYNGSSQPLQANFQNGKECSAHINRKENASIYLKFKYLNEDIYLEDSDSISCPKVLFEIEVMSGCNHIHKLALTEIIIDFNDRFEFKLSDEILKLGKFIKSCEKLSNTASLFLNDYISRGSDYFHDYDWMRYGYNGLMIDYYFAQAKNKTMTLKNVINDSTIGELSSFFEIGIVNEGDLYNVRIVKEPSLFKAEIAILEEIISICDYEEPDDSEFFNEKMVTSIFHYDSDYMEECNARMSSIIALSEKVKHKIFCPKVGRVITDLNETLINLSSSASGMINDKTINDGLNELNNVEAIYLSFVD